MEEKTIISIYGKEDLKKSGQFKKKNNVKVMTKEDFFIYLKKNNISIKPDYFDITAKMSNGKKFKGSYCNIIIGTSKICNDFNKIKDL